MKWLFFQGIWQGVSSESYFKGCVLPFNNSSGTEKGE